LVEVLDVVTDRLLDAEVGHGVVKAFELPASSSDSGRNSSPDRPSHRT
jgi:hypothetical protein